jgi:hypothetical protein
MEATLLNEQINKLLHPSNEIIFSTKNMSYQATERH